jgi:alkylation response protein AidB-like acyl-CoA dehydrogenase
MESPDRMSDVLAKVKELAGDLARDYAVRDQRREFPAQEMRRLKESGLLTLAIPRKYGGAELPFSQMVECLMLLAAGNPSVAQMFFVHCTIAHSLLEMASEEQQQSLFRKVVKDGAFIGNAASEKQSKHVMAYETTLTPAPSKDGVLIRGKKFFTTGSMAADYLLVFGRMGEGFASAVVPKDTPGLMIRDDWNAMGQRGTASGAIDFEDVFAPWDMVLPQPNSDGQPDPSNLLGPIYQIGFSAIHSGIARGALACAAEYVRTKSRPWPDSGMEAATDDPYVLQEVGKMSAYLSGAEALVRRAAELVENALALSATTPREEKALRRAEASVAVAEAKVVSTEVALRVCQNVFQVCGARSAMADQDLDRFWRDVRTLSLHDPKDYKAKLIGEYVLKGKHPAIGLYT